MRYLASLLFALTTTIFACAQGPCTEAAVKEGNLPMAEDAFSYMPPFGKPVTGKAAIQDAGQQPTPLKQFYSMSTKPKVAPAKELPERCSR